MEPVQDTRSPGPVLGFAEGAAGVLPSQSILRAIEEGWIDAGRFAMRPELVQPASLDLRIGETAYRIRASFLPGADTVERKVKTVEMDQLDLRGDGVLLETKRPYLIELKERLSLPAGVRAKANPKSSTGRVDVFTRVITEKSSLFDEIADGYVGPLYLEVVPLSFAIRVKEDLSLNQLRLSLGRADLTDDEIRAEHARRPMVFRHGRAVPADELSLANGLFLGLDLTGEEHSVGYQARDNAPPLDLTLSGPVHSDPYFEPVRHEEGDRLVLGQEKFYLLMSDESVAIPPTLAAEMTAYDPTSGELRTHYAGFFDPGFGYAAAGSQGSRAALEVRAHDVPFQIEHGQKVCKLTFERMLEEPEFIYGSAVGSSYQGQTDALGKQFVPPGREAGPPPVPELSAGAALTQKTADADDQRGT
jgi:dCTP deaminase